MKYDKMVLITYLLLNGLKMTTNETEYKDAHLVMFSADAMNPQVK
jgi:ribosomal protein L7Ae-like RNA K-turn-binding protein